jgi:anti-sigma regulatory factor (Ser/Thr protein kinase)
MVALLWDDGHIAGALDLESLWNRLASQYRFALFCAYALSSLETAGDLAAAKAMCDRHSHVVSLHTAASHAARVERRDSYEHLFLVVPSAPQDVRAFVRTALEAWGESELNGDVEIVASELATNAVRHARSTFHVAITRTASVIRISVRDASFEPPEHVVRDHAALGGRGVRLVAALTRAWGTDAEHDGKTVWAEVPRAAGW